MTDLFITLISLFGTWFLAICFFRGANTGTDKPMNLSDSEFRLMMRQVGLNRREIEAALHAKQHPNTYDPAQDPEKILKGEVESYFD